MDFSELVSRQRSYVEWDGCGFSHNRGFSYCRSKFFVAHFGLLSQEHKIAYHSDRTCAPSPYAIEFARSDGVNIAYNVHRERSTYFAGFSRDNFKFACFL